MLDKIQTIEEVEFYANEVITKGWSRDMLLNAIKMNTYSQQKRQIKTDSFEQALPEVHADCANEVFKSSYNLGFLGITEPVKAWSAENLNSVQMPFFACILSSADSCLV